MIFFIWPIAIIGIIAFFNSAMKGDNFEKFLK